jgi:hypothetical protein
MKTRAEPGINVRIKKNFAGNLVKKIGGFFAKTTASFCKSLIIPLVFGENAIFCEIGKNRRKL